MTLIDDWILDLCDATGAKAPPGWRDPLIAAQQAWRRETTRWPSVLAKTETPDLPLPTADPRDYVSIATYWWPNPDTPDGMPYLRRDGEPTPAIAHYDRPQWERLVRGVVIGVRCGCLAGERASARQAASLAHSWFLAPETRMNPHLRHAQFIPGQNTGRCYGIIDFALHLPSVLDHMALLAQHHPRAWSAESDAALRDWCEQFYTWLCRDPMALEEEAQVNNHGTWYDRLRLHLALYLGDIEGAQHTVISAAARIDTQIAADGRQAHELARTLSFSYSLMNLSAFADIALMAKRHMGRRFWTPRLDAAADFLHDHAAGDAPWPHPQIAPIDYRMLHAVLARVATATDRDFLCRFRHRLPADFDAMTFALLQPLHPFGHAREQH